ncbi:hypothetical protein NBRC116594_12160 [Shimia sp. NS0008-38b]|uniref:hypothetical protein n=1 Tax=Shimia sp. NS0008-38b TaxID=3127653 RepID=UPI0031044AB2
MSAIKEFTLPLVPFAFQVVLKVTLNYGQDWWYYIDTGTLLLTFSVWSIVLLAKVPSKTMIPSDDEIVESMARVRRAFVVFSMIGFALFGTTVYNQIIIDRLPGALEAANLIDLERFTIAAIAFAVCFIAYIAYYRVPVSKMVEA